MPFVSSVRGSFGPQSKTRRNFSTDMLNRITGGTITTSGGYRIHTFTTGSQSGGSYTFDTTSWGGDLSIEYLIVAGGGSGGNLGGGGGAGGLLTGLTNISANSRTVTIGGGASHSTPESGHSNAGNTGGNSSFAGLTAFGGGFGKQYNSGAAAGTGGSGGGGGAHNSGGGGGAGQVGENARIGNSVNGNVGGEGTSGQGFRGGDAFQSGYDASCNQGQSAGNGGNGLSVFGTTYAGGGGGGCHGSGANASGGSGGGGYGGRRQSCGPVIGQSGTNGLGGGGGGSGHDGGTYHSGAGGSGIVVVRYPV